MRPSRAVAIINPASAGGKTLERWRQVEDRVRSSFEEFEVLFTESPGHARLLCRDALERDAELVISVGGDGTHNEVLCGFVDEQGRNEYPHAELGLLASGTGSDFMRHLGPANLDEQVRNLLRQPAREVDYGVAEFVSLEGQPVTRPFLNEASVGVSGLIVDYVGRRSRFLGPTATYLFGSVRGILDYRDKPVTLVLDDGQAHKLPLTLAVMANGQYFGGGMWIAPEAKCDDGWLDILFTGGASKMSFLSLLARVFTGKHVLAPQVHCARSKTARLVPDDDRDVILVDLDGEQPGRLPARIQLMPAALRLRASGFATRKVAPTCNRFVPCEAPPGDSTESKDEPVLH